MSRAVVSAVINDRARDQRISAETEQRVRDAVRELGYVANLAARSLKGMRKRILGVHTFESVFPIARRDFYHEFLTGVEEQAVIEGHDLLLFTSAEGSDGRRKLYTNGSNRLTAADGAVLLGVTDDHSDLFRLSQERYPFVYIGRRDVHGADIAWVGPDYATAARDAVARLVAHGHRTIAYVGYPQAQEARADREAGYRAGCRAAGIPPLSLLVNLEDLSREWFDLALATGVTALVVELESFANQIAACAAARDLSIPADLSVVALGGTESGPVSERKWSCVGLPRRAVGRAAVSLLVAMLDAPDEPFDHQILLPCTPPDESTIAPSPAS
ncbi:LacI family DNA-binding transcriptional regulator [Rugosimonospora acidiphila]|uniref:LacI family DNA-binding transcriptional regulator n=1 Tax=Rugosimonospora acidiphila TaxID=556531 RepID=A0ABP9S1Q0_9ACTN